MKSFIRLSDLPEEELEEWKSWLAEKIREYEEYKARMSRLCWRVLEIGCCDTCGPDEIVCELEPGHEGDHVGHWGHGGGDEVRRPHDFIHEDQENEEDDE